MKNSNWTQQEIDFLVKKCSTNKSRMGIITDFFKKFGSIRTPDAIQRKITTLQQNGIVSTRKLIEDQLVIGVADIEMTSLKGNTGFMLSYYIKEYGRNKVCKGLIKPEEINNRTFDKRICKSLIEDIQKFDVIWFHYGEDGKFDIPTIRTRFAINGLLDDYEKIEKNIHIRDTYPIAKLKLNLSSNRLDMIADALGITTVKKTRLDLPVWMRAAYADPKALNYIFDHNWKDVLVLEQVVRKLKVVNKQKNVF